jgi:hypothetical protein
MNALQRSLVEKAGHDFGFEYAVKETSVVLILGSARHPLQAEVRFVDDVYKICIANAKPLFFAELGRDFSLCSDTFTCTSIEQLALFFKRSSALARSLPNQAEHDFETAVAVELEKLKNGVKSTEVEQLVRQRVGQDTYRKAMLAYWGGACAVTGMTMPEVLRASHALPWAECVTDAQRLDVFNGFLLTANLDALFDRFLISFDKEGYILVSDDISEDDKKILGLQPKLKLRWITERHELYLASHRARL